MQSWSEVTRDGHKIRKMVNRIEYIKISNDNNVEELNKRLTELQLQGKEIVNIKYNFVNHMLAGIVIEYKDEITVVNTPSNSALNTEFLD